MSTFKNKNSLRTIEAKIVQELKNNEARPKCTGSYKKKSVYFGIVLNILRSHQADPFGVRTPHSIAYGPVSRMLVTT